MTEKAVVDIGAGLRLAREQSGLTLRQIADTTKLSVRTLQALENNHVKQLPGGIYRRAIVRAYASEIGVDPEETLRAFLAQHPDDVPSATTAFDVAPASAAPRRLMHAVLSLFGALVPVLAAAMYFVFSAGGADAPSDIVDLLPPATEDAWEPEIVPASDSLGGELAMPAYTDSDRSVTMTISVSSPTRLQVMADGHEVLARLVDAGERLSLELGTYVVLLGDDAGAVHFSINGRAGRALGDPDSPLSALIARDDYQAWLIEP